MPSKPTDRRSTLRVRLAGLAGADVLWRVPGATPVDGTGSDLAVAVLGLALGIGEVPVVTELSTWLLLGYLAVTIAPRAYPETLGFPTTARGFRYSFAAITLAFAAFLRASLDRPALLIGGALVALASASLWYLWYLGRFEGWRLSPADWRFVRPFEAIFPASDVTPELRADFAREGVVGSLGAGTARLALGMIVAIPAVVSGIVVLTLLAAYPLPDVLILGWLGASVATRILDRDVRLGRRAVDLETRLYDVVTQMTKSIKGLTLGLYLLSVTFGFALLFGVSGTLVNRVELGPLWSVGAWRALWGIVGLFIGIAASSGYGIWSCFRMTTRLPTYLTYVVASTGETRSARRPRFRAERRRPIGFVLPPLLATFTLAVAVGTAGIDSLTFAVVWPIVVAALGGCVLLTTWRGTRDVRYDGHVVVFGTVLFALAIEVLGNLDAVIAAASDVRLSDVRVTGPRAAIDGIPQAIHVATVVLWFGYVDDVFRYADRHADRRRFLKSGYFAAFAVVFGALTVGASGSLAVPFRAILLASGIAAVLFFVVEWFEL